MPTLPIPRLPSRLRTHEDRSRPSFALLTGAWDQLVDEAGFTEAETDTEMLQWVAETDTEMEPVMASALDSRELVQSWPREMTLSQEQRRQSQRGRRGKRYAVTGTVVALSFGMFALMAVWSGKSSGLAKAKVEDSTYLVDGTCRKPADFCTGPGQTYSLKDCDADGIMDPFCSGDGICGCIASSNDCADNWPSPCLGGSMACQRPQGWCTGGFKFKYSTRDCDGDGQEDPFCQMTDSDGGEKSCGCLESSKGCFDNWPMVCPDLNSGGIAENQIDLLPGQTPVLAGSDGTLMYTNVQNGDTINPGDEVATVISGDSLVPVRTDKGGIVADTLQVHPGDKVTDGTRLATIAAMTALPKLPGDGSVIVSPDFAYLDSWGPGIKEGASVKKGQLLATLNINGELEDVTAPKDGKLGSLADIKPLGAVTAGAHLAKYATAAPPPPPPTPAPTTPKPKPKPATPKPTTPPKPKAPTVLPTLKGKGKQIIATGFKGEGTLQGWNPDIHAGKFVPKGTSVATLQANGGKVDVPMPETGIITVLSDIKPPHDINAGGQLGLYDPATPAVKTPDFPGKKFATNPYGGRFKKWKVDTHDKLTAGKVVGSMEVDGDVKPVSWDGPDGLVVDRAQLKPGDVVPPGTEFVSAGLGIFDTWHVKYKDEVKKGGNICSMKVGKEEKSFVKASESGTVLTMSDEKAGDIIGFDKAAPCSVKFGHHLPTLPIPEPQGNETKPIAIKAPSGQWLKLESWKVAEGDAVDENALIAVAKDESGAPLNLTTKNSGFIIDKQNIGPGDYIGPGDDLVVVGKSRPVGSGFPWWLVLLLLLCCLLCLLLLCCRSEPAPEPVREEPKPAPVPVPVREEPKPVYEPPPPREPEPVVVVPPVVEKAPEPPPPDPEPENPVVEEPPAPPAPPAPEPVPEGVPIYFDDVPYYFKYHPIGIQFNKHAPIEIDHFIFNSYGKTLGLKKGQRLTRIKDLDVHESHNFSMVDHKLLEALKPLPFWPLRIDFKAHTGAVKTYMAKEHPLGIAFTRHAPIKLEVIKKKSYGEELGFEKGWEIIRLGDVDVTGDHSFKHVDHMLLEGLAHLPKRGSADAEYDHGTGAGTAHAERPAEGNPAMLAKAKTAEEYAKEEEEDGDKAKPGCCAGCGSKKK